jgi:hypothetical protein
LRRLSPAFQRPLSRRRCPLPHPRPHSPSFLLSFSLNLILSLTVSLFLCLSPGTNSIRSVVQDNGTHKFPASLSHTRYGCVQWIFF